MPRKLQIEFGGAIYHRMYRGDRREPSSGMTPCLEPCLVSRITNFMEDSSRSRKSVLVLVYITRLLERLDSSRSCHAPQACADCVVAISAASCVSAGLSRRVQALAIFLIARVVIAGMSTKAKAI